ncbi:MAG: phosphate/phosphite/phosphonate ABC transporter substrate-binding protein [Thiohalomonadales bacterium]
MFLYSANIANLKLRIKGVGSMLKLARLLSGMAGCLYILFAFELQASVQPLADVDQSRVASKVGHYILGVFPYLPNRELEKIFAPFAASIGKAMGREMLFESSNTFQNFMARSDAELFDVAFVQPFDYVRLVDQYNYVPLATRGEPLATVFMVREDSPINDVAGLKGKIVAMPPAVAAVSRLAKHYLHTHHIIPGKDVAISHQRSHAACLQQVLIRAADACSTAMPPVLFMQKKMKVNFKKIARSKEIPPALFIAHKRLTEDERKTILATILSWSNSVLGTHMLHRGGMIPFAVANDKDYDTIREIIRNENNYHNR